MANIFLWSSKDRSFVLITEDLPGLKSIIQTLYVRLSTALIKVNNFISGARKCTAMVFFQGGKGAFVYHPPYHKLMVPAKAFFIIFYQICLCDQQRNKVTKMMGLYSVKSSIDSRSFKCTLKSDLEDATWDFLGHDLKMVFCYQNCSDLLCERSDREKLLNFWDH